MENSYVSCFCCCCCCCSFSSSFLLFFSELFVTVFLFIASYFFILFLLFFFSLFPSISFDQLLLFIFILVFLFPPFLCLLYLPNNLYVYFSGICCSNLIHSMTIHQSLLKHALVDYWVQVMEC